MNGLNPRQEAFAQLLAAKRLSASEAYSEAYKLPKGPTTEVNGSKLLRNTKVAERVEEIEMDMQQVYQDEARNAFNTVRDLMINANTPPNVRLQAAKDIQDRAGLGATHRIETTKKLDINKTSLSDSEVEEMQRLLDAEKAKRLVTQ
jgi:hypothetical protein